MSLQGTQSVTCAPSPNQTEHEPTAVTQELLGKLLQPLSRKPSKRPLSQAWGQPATSCDAQRVGCARGQCVFEGILKGFGGFLEGIFEGFLEGLGLWV